MKIYYRGSRYYTLDQCWDIQARTGGEFMLRSEDEELFRKLRPGEVLHPLRKDEPAPFVQGVVVETMAGPAYRNDPNVRNVFCYHGMAWGHLLGPSRKHYNHGPYPKDISFFDYYLASGPRDVLKYRWHFRMNEAEAARRCIPVGWLRSDRILGTLPDREELRARLGIAGTRRPVVLFAPTGTFASGSLLTHGPAICKRLDPFCAVLVRSHPGYPRPAAELMEIVQKAGLENVHFVESAKVDLIENMAAADLLISDQSAVIMDWLFFRRPLIFTDSPLVLHLDNVEWSTGPRFDVRRCGPSIPADGSGVEHAVEEALTVNTYAQAVDDYREDCFYFNDGRAAERAADFISELASSFPRRDPRKMHPKFEWLMRTDQVGLLFLLRSPDDWASLAPLYAALCASPVRVSCFSVCRMEDGAQSSVLSTMLARKGIAPYPAGADVLPPVVIAVNTLRVAVPDGVLLVSVLTDDYAPELEEQGRAADVAFVSPGAQGKGLEDFTGLCVRTADSEKMVEMLNLGTPASWRPDAQGDLVCRP